MSGTDMTDEQAYDNADVTDPEALFRFSLMVDALRDTAGTLLGHDVSEVTQNLMRGEYNRLRRAIMGCLEAGRADQTRRMAPKLSAEAAGVDAVFTAASLLARWADSVMQTPGFRVNRRLAEANARQAMSQAEQFLGCSAPERPDDTRTGSYL